MLKEALDRELITITEVDRAGSVPELKVINRSEQFVLMLDGEELMGAKQNRVLNTSILLKPKSEMTVPVSCTEQGRWGYSSPTFGYSDIVMSPSVRSSKSLGVSRSYMLGRGARSDQSEVWADIAELHEEGGTSSETGAMRDAYTAKEKDLDAYLKAFEFVSGQKGCLVFINGEAVGLDLLSREAAYRTVHPQLVKSYAMDALVRDSKHNGEVSTDKADAFLQEAMRCKESRFESAGEGYDYRFEGSKAIGSALVYEERVIHGAFFKVDGDGQDVKPDQDVHMSGYSQRRRFRGRRP